jgi:plastocyanin
MNKKILIAMSVSVFGLYGTSQVTAQDNCPVVEVPDQCAKGGQITINNNSNNVSPRNLCARPGDTITVNVTPNNTTAIVHGKNGGWPYASNGSNNKFTITAPAEGDYNYNVTFHDGRCIDPRITVKR